MEMNLSDDYEFLIQGLNTWEFPSDITPSELLLISEASFPVLVNRSYQVLIGASHYGQGRMVVLSHENCLYSDKMAPFLKNAVKWLRQSKENSIGVNKSVERLASVLQDAGIEVEVVNCNHSQSVFCTDAFDSTNAKQLVQFMKNGGGLLIAGHTLKWAKEHGDAILDNFPGNHVTSVAGIYFTETQADTRSLKLYHKIPKIPVKTKFEEDISKEQQRILDGISKLDIRDGGIPSRLLVHGYLAFPLGLSDPLDCSVAGARYGRGRVIVLSHEGLLFSPNLGQFLINAVRWLKGDQPGKIGVIPPCQNLFHWLTENGMDCTLQNNVSADLSVYCCTAYNDSLAKEILEFVAEGGGLLTGGQAWYWASKNPNKSVFFDFPGNRILNSFGISILNEYVNKGHYDCPGPGLKNYHFRLAIAQFFDELKNKTGKFPKDWQSKLSMDYSAFLWMSTGKIPFYDHVHRMLKKVIKTTKLPIINNNNPLFKNSCNSTLIHLASELSYVKPDFASKLYKSGYQTSILPSSSPAHSVSMEMNLTSQSGNIWKSTGLYLPQGCTLNITIPHSACFSNIKVQIGCHTDNLMNLDKTLRAPVVVYQYDLTKPDNSISTLWGGLVYIIVPHDCSLGNTVVTFTGAVPAPYFILGKTSVEEWKNSIRHHPVPWGELQADSIILTVPAKSLQGIENPEPVLHLWNEMTEAIAKLSAKPHPFPRHERIVTDVQIAYGLMHAGYPIMGFLDVVNELISEEIIRKKGLWCPIHELGHNQQFHAWEFPQHTTDATCNLWSVYVHEKVLKLNRNHIHPALRPEQRQRRLEEYKKKGAPLSMWYTWTALETYLQLQEAFGWESFIQVFKTYQQLTNVPKEKEDKMNLWVTKFSEQVQKNLAPFFKAWGWPVQEKVETAIAHLPEWKENPMKSFCDL
ncbi:TRPM8 channel-associated factor 2-like isoform X2 [Sminthopsis crassicaudata]|uniref:TRPM8 channel-associated factor 2-like isoform X2 n=1 Tax=Sminthopsis crassicaudata TaxID=9301 RepID=UPI003D686D5A